MSTDKIVVVTGASSGIGQATVRLLSQNGFKVFAGSRNPDKSGPVPGVEYGRLDVDNDESVRQFVDWVLSRSGRIDVVVNNAGVSLVGPVESTSDYEAKAVFETNVFGPLRMIRAVLPAMRQQNSGLIVNVSSVLGFLPAPYMGLYASSKHALEGLSETLDHEVRQFIFAPSWLSQRSRGQGSMSMRSRRRRLLATTLTNLPNPMRPFFQPLRQQAVLRLSPPKSWQQSQVLTKCAGRLENRLRF